MIRVHHLEASRSTRLLWLLEELEIDYEIVRYQRDSKTMRAPASLREIHPLGRSPLLEIDGQILAESGAILMYLTEREGRFGPPQADGKQDFHYWLHYAEASAMPPLLVKLLTTTMRRAKVPFFIKPIVRTVAEQLDATFTDGELRAHFGWIEEALSTRDFFAGSAFTAADIQMSFPIQASFARAGVLPERPFSQAWLKRVESRPAYQRALEKGGPPIMKTLPR